MALSVAAGPHAANGAGTVTTAAFTPTDGSLVVACMCLQWGGDPPTVSDSLGGTWTSRAVSTGGTVARIYTRPVVTGASMTVSVEPGSPPRFSRPRELFATAASTNSNVRNRYDVSKDGQRFLILTSGGETQVGPTTVVLDWLGRLEKH